MTKQRSPNYPQLSLEKSVEFTKRIYQQVGRSALTDELVAKALGYGSLHGPARSTIAALGKYGLLEKSGTAVRISDLALKILHPTDENQRESAISEAALNPPLFRGIYDDFADLSEEMLANRLVHAEFTSEGAKRAAKAYKANEVFAKLGVEKHPNPVKVLSNEPERQYSKHRESPSRVMITPLDQHKALLAEYRLPIDSENEVELRFIGKELNEDSFSALEDFLAIIKRRFKAKN